MSNAKALALPGLVASLFMLVLAPARAAAQRTTTFYTGDTATPD